MGSSLRLQNECHHCNSNTKTMSPPSSSGPKSPPHPQTATHTPRTSSSSSCSRNLPPGICSSPKYHNVRSPYQRGGLPGRRSCDRSPPYAGKGRLPQRSPSNRGKWLFSSHRCSIWFFHKSKFFELHFQFHVCSLGSICWNQSQRSLSILKRSFTISLPCNKKPLLVQTVADSISK